MKIKILATFPFLLLFAGCATTTPGIVTVKTEAVPLLVCPAPPDVTPPRLMTDDLTDADRNDPDKIAKAYKGSVIQLKAYIAQLEAIIQQYGKTSQQYTELRKQLLQKYPELQQTHPELFK